MSLKNGLRVIGLGLVIWSLSLIWPEVNEILSRSTMLGLVAWLGLGFLLYLLNRPPEQRPPRNGEARPNCSSRPVPTVQ